MTTFSMPSAAQNSFCAKGKSLDIHSTLALFKLAAVLLNSLTEVEQTLVLMLGKIFKIRLENRFYKNNAGIALKFLKK